MTDRPSKMRLGGNKYSNNTPPTSAPPPNATLDMSKQKEAESRFENEKLLKQSFSSFLNIFNKKTLLKFKTQTDINDEQIAILGLHTSSANVQSRDVNILIFRLVLGVRDRLNQLEVENTELAKELLRLRNQLEKEKPLDTNTAEPATNPA